MNLGYYFNFWAIKIRISKHEFCQNDKKNMDSIAQVLVARFINALHQRANIIGR